MFQTHNVVYIFTNNVSRTLTGQSRTLMGQSRAVRLRSRYPPVPCLALIHAPYVLYGLNQIYRPSFPWHAGTIPLACRPFLSSEVEISTGAIPLACRLFLSSEVEISTGTIPSACHHSITILPLPYLWPVIRWYNVPHLWPVIMKERKKERQTERSRNFTKFIFDDFSSVLGLLT